MQHQIPFDKTPPNPPVPTIPSAKGLFPRGSIVASYSHLPAEGHSPNPPYSSAPMLFGGVCQLRHTAGLHLPRELTQRRQTRLQSHESVARPGGVCVVYCGCFHGCVLCKGYLLFGPQPHPLRIAVLVIVVDSVQVSITTQRFPIEGP